MLDKNVKYIVDNSQMPKKASSTKDETIFFIEGESLNECLNKILYTPNLINKTVKLFENKEIESITFETALDTPPILFERDSFVNLAEQWKDSMIEIEEYETAAKIRDFLEKNKF